MRKIILLLLLSMSVSLVACKEKEEPVSEVPVLLTETVVEKEETTPTQSAQTNPTQTAKPKPTYNSNNIIVVEEKQEEVVEVVDEIVEEDVPTVEELIEEEEANSSADELLQRVKKNTPMNYRMELNGKGTTSSGAISEWKVYSDISQTVRHDALISNLTGNSVTSKDIWYDFTKGEIHTYEKGNWTKESVGLTFNVINAIIDNSKYPKFVDSEVANCYAIQVDLPQHTIGHNISCESIKAIIYVDKSTELVNKVIYTISDDFMRLNNLSAFNVYILFGNYNTIDITIPSDAVEEVPVVDRLVALNNMNNAINDNYTAHVKYGENTATIMVTGGNIQQTIDATVAGVPTSLFMFFDASLQKTFSIMSRNTQAGLIEELAVTDGVFDYINIKQFLSSSRFDKEITPIWNTMYAYTGTSPSLNAFSLFVVPEGLSAVHINRDNYYPMYIELQDTPTSLTDRDLNNANNLVSIYDIGTTNISISDTIKLKFPEYFY